MRTNPNQKLFFYMDFPDSSEAYVKKLRRKTSKIQRNLFFLFFCIGSSMNPLQWIYYCIFRTGKGHSNKVNCVLEAFKLLGESAEFSVWEIILPCLWGSQSEQIPWRTILNLSSPGQLTSSAMEIPLHNRRKQAGTGATISLINKIHPICVTFYPLPSKTGSQELLQLPGNVCMA